MSNDRIKVVGYSQQVVYNGNIEYRNFTPDLVGVQLASNGGTPLFTMGNFSVTTNFDPKINRTFVTNNFSNFTTLSSFDLTLQKTLDLLTNNAGVILNLDKRNLSNYALFNTTSEYTRVALENIITNWSAALYITALYQPTIDSDTLSGNTFENYTYDAITNTSSFSVSTFVINNVYQINYLKNGTLKNTFNSTNDMRNMTVNYSSYAILVNGSEYNVTNFTPATSLFNNYLYFTVVGNPFSGASSGYLTYHIKPNATNENLFFNSLENFEYYLLNRLSNPKYTATFNFTVKSDTGNVLYVSDSVTWPTTDGYNLDFDTDAYVTYATRLLNIATEFDLTTSNLMIRFLVADSITDFDTTNTHLGPLDTDTSGQKINKTLTIYGVEYDKINQFIKGVKFANTVSYNKQDNMPDIYLKNLARVLGWELISSVLENDLLKSYIDPKPSTYAGQSVGLTLVEADVELWRRIILNTPWLWKSKGTRKGIEFLFKFIGIPSGLITFNEYIYAAENQIDVNQLVKVLELNNLSTDITTYPIDSNGYPNPLPNTSNMYFQGKGLWYRETSGANSVLDITTGNNPHIGPYDGGAMYINQFKSLIPNFKPVTISSQTETTHVLNMFSNYNSGTFKNYNGSIYVNVIDSTNTNITETSKVSIINDPYNRLEETDNGCPISGEAKSLSILIKGGPLVSYTACWYNLPINPDYLCQHYFYTAEDKLIFKIPSLIVNGKEYITDLPVSSPELTPSTIEWVSAYNGITCPATNVDTTWGVVYLNFVNFLNNTFTKFGLNYKAQMSLIDRSYQTPDGGKSDLPPTNNGYGFYIIRPKTDNFKLYIDSSYDFDLLYTENSVKNWYYYGNQILSDDNLNPNYFYVQCANNPLGNDKTVIENPKIQERA